MEIKIKDGKVVATTDEPNEEFLSIAERFGYIAPDFGYKDRYTWMREVGKEYDCVGAAGRNLNKLDQIIDLAESYGVTVDQDVIAERDRVKKEYDRLSEKKNAFETAMAKRREWQFLCKNGCGHCKSLRQHIDTFKCAACGEELPQKNVPFYDYESHIQYLFNFVPFPSENCPHKAE